MAFNLATAFMRLDKKRAAGNPGVIGTVQNRIQDMTRAPIGAIAGTLGAIGTMQNRIQDVAQPRTGTLADKIQPIAHRLASMLNPMERVSTAIRLIQAGAGIGSSRESSELSPLAFDRTDASRRPWKASPAMTEKLKQVYPDFAARYLHTDATSATVANVTKGMIPGQSISIPKSARQGIGARITSVPRSMQLAQALPRISTANAVAPGSLANKSRPFPEQASSVSLTSLATKMQQEAEKQDLDRQQLAAQQQANGHLGTLAGASQGPGLKVQIVGAQPGQW